MKRSKAQRMLVVISGYRSFASANRVYEGTTNFFLKPQHAN